MFRIHPLILSLCLLLPMGTWGQSFSDAEKIQGYALKGDSTYFIFDDERYQQTSAVRVVVTGSFRSWSQDMDDPAWQLADGSLGVSNPGYELIPPGAEFKFRINDGEWLQPLSEAPNQKGGNLVFMHDVTPPSLKAEILSSGNIRMITDGLDRSLDPNDYKLTNAQGNEIPIAEILPNTMNMALVIPGKALDKSRVYFLEIKEAGLKSWCSFDGWFRDVYSHKELGANIADDGSETVFRIFAPRAEALRLHLYKEAEGGEAYQEVDMVMDADGVWEAEVGENLKGVYYDFTVYGPDEPGNQFYGTLPVHVSDPYARVNVDAWGRSRVWERTQAATPLKNGIPPMEDVIAYEVHVQDFTDQLPVDPELKGTFPAFHEPGLKNRKGAPVGFDYLVDLGINVVHLMPVQEFLHYKDEEWQEAFKDDPFMIKHGINMENYQWGYRTSHAFAVENRFRRKGDEHGAERDQFRDLVQAFHDRDIAVIIDLVPNHTAENMDSEPYHFHWSVLDKIYYYRTKDLDLIGEYGNEVKTENRPMVQRWLIDQCKHFIEEFGVDGFRIDLAGQIDKQTLTKVRKALGEDIIIYGEPWIGSYDPEYEANPSWDWYKEDSPITFFQDGSRNAFKGPVFDIEEKVRDQGYAGGNIAERDNVKLGLSAGFPEDKTPLSGINYLDIHDNWALADQLAANNFNGMEGVDEARFKIAAVLLYTSLGPIVNHGGTEMMRSKGSAELKETVKETKTGLKVYLHGKRDTYNMRVPNQFEWENAGKTAKDKGSRGDFKGMYAFWQGLNRFRLSEYGQVFRQAEPVPEGYYQWLDTGAPELLGYMVDEKVLVLINVGETQMDWANIELPEGNWRLIGNLSGVDHEEGVKDKIKADRKLEGGKAAGVLVLDGPSFKIWVKD